MKMQGLSRFHVIDSYNSYNKQGLYSPKVICVRKSIGIT